MVFGKKHKALYPFKKQVMFNLFSPLAAECGAEAAAPAQWLHRMCCSEEGLVSPNQPEVTAFTLFNPAKVEKR